MRLVLPEDTELLLDVSERIGAEQTWRALQRGALLAVHWDMDSGETRPIDRPEWMKMPDICEEGGKVVKRHPVEMLEKGDLFWLVSSGGPGRRVGSDPVLVLTPMVELLEAVLSDDGRSENDNAGGRPEHPAKEWYEDRGFNREGMSLKELQRLMERELQVAAPSENTIRNWERDAQ